MGKEGDPPGNQCDEDVSRIHREECRKYTKKSNLKPMRGIHNPGIVTHEKQCSRNDTARGMTAEPSLCRRSKLCSFRTKSISCLCISDRGKHAIDFVDNSPKRTYHFLFPLQIEHLAFILFSSIFTLFTIEGEHA